MGSTAGRPSDVPDSVVAAPRRWLVAIVSGGFFLLLAYILLQQAWVHRFDILALALLAAAFTGAVVSLDGISGRLRWTERNRRIAFAIGFLVVFSLQLMFVRAIYTTVGWDPRAVFAAAIDLSNFTQSSVASHTPEVYRAPGLSIPYWSSYPNNLMLAFTYELIFRVCATLGFPNPVFLCTALNVLVLDIAVLLAAVCARRLWGRKAGRITLLVAVPFLGFSPWISLAYSDTIATVFPVLLLYLYIRYVESTRATQYLYAAAIAATSAAGYLFKPHVLAMTLAIGIVHGLSPRSGSSLMVKLGKLATFGLVALMVLGAFGAYRGHRLKDRIPTSQIEASRFPITHWIAMSLNDARGGFNKKDVDEQRALIGLEAKNERNVRVIKQRLSELGPSGYAGFLHRKLSWISTDGTFYWQREGIPVDYVPLSDDRYARRLQSVLFREGEHFRWFEMTANAAWLAVLAWMVAPLATRRRFEADRMILIARLAVIVLLLMLLVLEGRSRYLISFVPLFVMLGSYYLSGARKTP